MTCGTPSWGCRITWHVETTPCPQHLVARSIEIEKKHTEGVFSLQSPQEIIEVLAPGTC